MSLKTIQRKRDEKSTELKENWHCHWEKEHDENENKIIKNKIDNEN